MYCKGEPTGLPYCAHRSVFPFRVMNLALQTTLADNAKQWQALSLAISMDEKAAFDRIHDELFATYGSNFMAHVYRQTFERGLQHQPEAERLQLLADFRQALGGALDEHFSTSPSVAQCLACHARRA